MCYSSAVQAVTHQDVFKAIEVVTTKLNIPVVVEVVDMEDPLAATWKPSTDTCHIYVSKDNLGGLTFMTLGQRKDHMIEGYIAHELAHCYELKTLTSSLGTLVVSVYMRTLEARIQAEITGDIVAIMYWNQEYPLYAKYYTKYLMEWRRVSQYSDKEHATFPHLFSLVSDVPNVVDMCGATALRDKYYNKSRSNK